MPKPKVPSGRGDTRSAVSKANSKAVAQLVAATEAELLEAWLTAFKTAVGPRMAELTTAEDLHTETRALLRSVTVALSRGIHDVEAPEFAEILATLRDISVARAEQGFTPSETARYVMSLKDVLLRFIQEKFGHDPAVLINDIINTSNMIDSLAIVTLETYAARREELIGRQTRSLIRASMPSLRVWEELLMMPLVGVIDTTRAQQIMETLLHSIVETESSVVILDVTGVPVIDTRVAQHLMKAVSAARMLGAQVVVTGISPDAAQTLTKLDIDLTGILTRGSLHAGLATAFDLLGLKVAGKESSP